MSATWLGGTPASRFRVQKIAAELVEGDLGQAEPGNRAAGPRGAAALF
jgi:hypothetical protein